MARDSALYLPRRLDYFRYSFHLEVAYTGARMSCLYNAVSTVSDVKKKLALLLVGGNPDEMKLCFYGSTESLERPDLSLTDVFKATLAADEDHPVCTRTYGNALRVCTRIFRSPRVWSIGVSYGSLDTASLLAKYARQSCLL